MHRYPIDFHFNQKYTLGKVKLYKRTIFSNIEPYIGDNTVIVLHGARQVGKTHILLYVRDWLERKNHKVFYYDLEYPEILADFNKGIDLFIATLQGRGYQENEEVYVLVDEIQYLDNPSSFLKIIADYHKNIHLIVSGSSTFAVKSKFTDSLAGRTTSFEVYPLSFAEFLQFKEIGLVFTQTLAPSAIAQLVRLYREFIIYGGYPRVVLEAVAEKKKQYLLQVIDTYIRKDVRDLAHVDDLQKFNSLLKILASRSGQLLDMTSLCRETAISFPTLQKYLSVLEETFVIKRVPPYSKSIGVEIRKNPKVFFFDSGIQTLLWLNAFQDTILGSVFETNIFSQLVMKYGRQSIRFWRTKIGQEIDFIVLTGDMPLPIEAKINFSTFSRRSIDSFHKRYGSNNWHVVAMDGEKLTGHGLFPWEI